MKVQYFHDRKMIPLFNNSIYTGKFDFAPKGGRTIVMEKISPDLFDKVDLAGGSDIISLQVGVAVCSKKDNYCKATGRQFADSRMKEQMFVCTGKAANKMFLYCANLNLEIELCKGEKSINIVGAA